jgi:hypothetical protein
MIRQFKILLARREAAELERRTRLWRRAFRNYRDWDAVEFARRLHGLAVSASTPPGRLHLHPIEFNKQSRCHGSHSKRREAANIYSLTAEARGPGQRRGLTGRTPLRNHRSWLNRSDGPCAPRRSAARLS